MSNLIGFQWLEPSRSNTDDWLKNISINSRYSEQLPVNVLILQLVFHDVYKQTYLTLIVFTFF